MEKTTHSTIYGITIVKYTNIGKNIWKYLSSSLLYLLLHAIYIDIGKGSFPISMLYTCFITDIGEGSQSTIYVITIDSGLSLSNIYVITICIFIKLQFLKLEPIINHNLAILQFVIWLYKLLIYFHKFCLLLTYFSINKKIVKLFPAIFSFSIIFSNI